MRNKEDLRVIKTEKALIQAFFSLMQKKNFDEITINELCEKAMIRRATFYKHYQDRYDFFAHAIKYFFDTFDYSKSGILPSADPLENYLYSINLILDFVSSNTNIVQSVYRSSMFPLLMTISTEQITKSIKTQILKDIENGLLTDINPDIAVAVISGAFLSLLQLWIENKDNIPKEEMLRNVDAILRRMYV